MSIRQLLKSIIAGVCFPVFLVLSSARASVPEGMGGLRVVELEGTPYQMGKIHGTALKSEITELLRRWKADLAGTYGVPAEEFIRTFLAHTDFLPAVERWTPGLVDEVRGIADGAGVGFDTMFAFQLLDEMWTMSGELGLDKCTSIGAGARGATPAFTSQTLDVPEIYHGFPTVLRIREESGRLETLVFTIPGVIAANGLNSRSVGVCVNAVTQLAHSTKGLPVAFVIRGILRRKTYADAERFLREIQPAAPQNYILGGPGEAACFERSAARMVRFLPFEGAEFTYHTNHPRINDDFVPGFTAKLKQDGMSLETYRSVCPRFRSLGGTLADNSTTIDLPALKAIYANRASGINNATTYGCTIMILGGNPELHISPGRPDVEPFRVLGFLSGSAD
jgi:isopenicillin-N N-acyltransferase like protein